MCLSFIYLFFLVAINLTTNKSAFGVGYLSRSSDDLYMCGGHGVAVKILHLFGDKLWAHEPTLAQQVPQFKSTNLTDEDFPALVSKPALNKKQNEEEPTVKENNEEAIRNSNSAKQDQIALSEVARTELEIGEEDTLKNSTQNLLKHAFLSALKKHGSNLQLPLLTSNFFRLYVVPEALEPLDLKKTKYKKLSNFLNEMIDEGFIVVREDTKGVDKITSIDLEHPDLVNFITDFDYADSTKGTLDNPLFHSELTELYIVTDATAPFFTKLNYQRGVGIPASQIKHVIKAYLNKLNLPMSKDPNAADNKSYILDDCLEKICKTKIATISQIICSVISQMDHTYQMCTAKDVKLNKPMIQMSIATRHGNKKVTLVSNIECYGIILSEFIKLCKQSAAASATIVTFPNQNRSALQIQGNQVRLVYTLLTEKYKIPAKRILGLELAKDGKKHKK